LVKNSYNRYKQQPQALTLSTLHCVSLGSNQNKAKREQDKPTATSSLLTLSNIQYLVEGLDTLLVTNLDGNKRSKVIELRNELMNYINSLFDDYS
jgi:hypothetical protein